MYSPNKDRPAPARVEQCWVASGMQGAGRCSWGVDWNSWRLVEGSVLGKHGQRRVPWDQGGALWG